MKKISPLLGLAVLLVPAATFAAGVSLNNGGVGQIASDPSQFGVSVCNNGKAATTQAVPVSVNVNGQVVTVPSAPIIAAGACEYSYVSYSQLNMLAGQTYNAAVTIDPQKTMISNSDNQTTYVVIVPPVAAADAQASANTADVNAQSGNIFTMFFHWVAGFFGAK